MLGLIADYNDQEAWLYGQLTKNFHAKEFNCPCCEMSIMNPRFISELQKLRKNCGFPFLINSGYRCETYNTKISKNTVGQHVEGKAADIKMLDRNQRFILLRNIFNMGYFKDVAISATFIHIGTGNRLYGVGVYRK